MAAKKTTRKKTPAAKSTTKKASNATAKTATRKRTPAKKSERKTSPQADAKNAEPKATAKPLGLRQPQLRILAALAKVKTPLNRKEVSEQASVDKASLVEYLGSPDSKRREANDKKHFPSLVTLKFVTAAESEDGSTAYKITAAGRKAAN